MRANTIFCGFLTIALTAAGYSLSPAYGQWQSPEAGPRSTPAPVPGTAVVTEKPSANYEMFKSLKSRCETEVSCGKGSGDICADAAAILLSAEPPGELRDLNEPQRVKIALRLLERGVDTSNLAAGRAYDLYSKVDLLIFGSFGGYSDPVRATELMDLMIKRSYPGGPLRKARSAVSFLSLTAPESDKRQGCTLAKQLLAEGKLDADSTRIANEVMESSYCKNLTPQ